MAYSSCTETVIEINFIVLKEWMKSVIWLLENKTSRLFHTFSCSLTREYPNNLDYLSSPSAKCYALDHRYTIEALRLFQIDRS